MRFSFEPEGGEKTIDEDAAKALGDDYLQTGVLDRCAAGGIRLRLVLQLGEDGDPTDDPTAAWPEERETVVAGQLELTAPTPSASAMATFWSSIPPA